MTLLVDFDPSIISMLNIHFKSTQDNNATNVRFGSKAAVSLGQLFSVSERLLLSGNQTFRCGAVSTTYRERIDLLSMLAIGPGSIRFGMLILGAVANPLLAILIPDENLTVVINSAPGENPVLASLNHAGQFRREVGRGVSLLRDRFVGTQNVASCVYPCRSKPPETK
jgi:hypothetical protein